MNDLKKQYQDLTHFLDQLYRMNLKINIYYDKNKNYTVLETGHCDKIMTSIGGLVTKFVNAEFVNQYHKYAPNANLNIEIICKQGKVNEVLLAKSDICSKRLVKIIVHYKNSIEDLFEPSDVVSEWSKQIQKTFKPKPKKKYFYYPNELIYIERVNRHRAKLGLPEIESI